MQKLFLFITISGWIVALPQIWGSNWKNIWTYYFRHKISWGIVHEACLKMIQALQNDDFIPTLIIGVGRGGTICSGIVCSELNKKKLRSQSNIKKESSKIRLEILNTNICFQENKLYANDTFRQNSPKIERTEIDNVDFKIVDEDKILLIGAQNYLGIALKMALDNLLTVGIDRQNIRTASIFGYEIQNGDLLREKVHDPDYISKILNIKTTMPWKNKKFSTDRF